MPNETTKRRFLESLTIASPCEVDWNEMTGDDITRYCDRCEKKVYNISEMSRQEAELFIQQQEASVCVRMYRRHDGTVINDDCPIGLRTLKEGYSFVKARVWQVAASFATIISATASALIPSLSAQAQNQVSGDQQPPKNTTIPKTSAPRQLMGKVACPQPSAEQLEAEESYKKELSAKVLEKVPSVKGITRGSVWLRVDSTGKLDYLTISPSTGDKKLDDEIISAIKQTKVSMPKEGWPTFRNMYVNIKEIGEAKPATQKQPKKVAD